MSHSHPHQTHAEKGSEKIEKRDVHFGWVTAGLGSLTIFILVSIVTCLICFKGLKWFLDYTDKPTAPMFESKMVPAEPRLQSAEAQDFIEVQKEQREMTESYAVIDEAAQIARIPVKRAMQMLAEKPEILNPPAPEKKQGEKEKVKSEAAVPA